MLPVTQKNLTLTYSILRNVIQGKSQSSRLSLRKYKGIFTYSDLSDSFATKAGFRPSHREWDLVLDAINCRLCKKSKRPPISAIIIRRDTKMPGDSFWMTCCVSSKIKKSLRRQIWHQYVRLVAKENWPPNMP